MIDPATLPGILADATGDLEFYEIYTHVEWVSGRVLVLGPFRSPKYALDACKPHINRAKSIKFDVRKTPPHMMDWGVKADHPRGGGK